jgi:addiction module HigA family antidote
MQQQSYTFWHLRLETSWKHCAAIEKASTRFGSTINGGFVLFGVTAIATTWRSSTITRRGAAKMSKPETLVPPVHPGEILREDFMKPLGLSVNKLALELHVPATRIGEIVHQRRRITAETALRLARYFNTNAEFWLNLQNFYDLEISRRSGKVSEIERQVHPALAS